MAGSKQMRMRSSVTNVIFHEQLVFAPYPENFDDPSRLIGSEADIFAEYRRVRDDIKNWIVRYLGGTP